MPYSNSAHQNGPRLAALAGVASPSAGRTVPPPAPVRRSSTPSYAVYNNSGVAVSSPVRVNDVASTTVDVQQELDSIVPLQNGNFFANLRHDERGGAPNQDEQLHPALRRTSGGRDGHNDRLVTRKTAIQQTPERCVGDVTFAASVTGLSSSNFALAQGGVSGASVTGVAGSGTDWVVTASTGSGSGTLGPEP